jgi:predicted phosphodiesterase
MKKTCIMLLLLIISGSMSFAQLPQDGLVGQWDFNDTTSLVKATIGSDLVLEAKSGKTPSQMIVAGPEANNGAVALPVGVYYRLHHGIAANGGGKKVNQYTLVFDFKKPDIGTWSNFFCTNTDVTSDDGDCFINKTNHIGTALTGYTGQAVTQNEWYRLVITADLGNFYNYYLDGELATEGGAQEKDGRFALAPVDGDNALLISGDDDGEDAPIHFARVAIYNRALTADEVKKIGGYHEPVAEVVPERLPFIQMPDTASVCIAWRTTDKFLGKVEYGKTTSYGSTITEDSAVSKHFVTLNNLEPNTKYYYRVYNNSTLFYDNGYFYTAKPDNVKQVSFLAWGDSGVNTDVQYKIAGMMEKEPVDFCVHVGDVNQNVGEEYDLTFFKPYKNIVTNKCVYTTFGNHDTYTNNGAVYLDAFYLPHNNAANTEKYYSYRWGNAFFIFLDSEIDYSPSSPQYKFLVDQLQSERKKSADWTIMVFHRPPYCEFWDTYGGEEDERTYLLPLFESNGVDLVLNGHTHAYEHGVLNGVNYVITGGGGGGLDTFGRDWPHITKSVAAFHYSKVEINDKELAFKAIDLNGRTLDSFNISKTATSVDDNKTVPAEYSLDQNYPNPFNPSTKISFALPVSSQVRIKVYSITGEVVANVLNTTLEAGHHEVEFDGSKLASGVYIYRIEAGSFIKERKMMILK